MSSKDNLEDSIDWSYLESIKTFDSECPLLHDGMSSTAEMAHQAVFNPKEAQSAASKQNDWIDSISSKSTTPVSLLVESLLHQLCSMIESDAARADNLYQTVCKQLHRINLIDESYLMSEFDVIRSQFQRSLYQLTAVVRGQTDIPLNLQSVWPLNDSMGMTWSRYNREFDELNFIAGGGFGRVYRARHKLDGIEYAVKKVTIKTQTINSILSHLAEVKTFASLNHTNIVPYKAAWLEPLFDDVKNPPRATTVKRSHKNERRTYAPGSNRKGNISMALVNFAVNGTQFDKVEFDDDFDDDDDDEESDGSENTEASQSENKFNAAVVDESSDFVVFEPSNNDDAIDGANFSQAIQTRHETNCDLNVSKALCKVNNALKEATAKNNNFNDGNVEMDLAQPHLKLKWATLYIQMAFRPLTLRAWLDERNKHANFNDFYVNFIEKSVEDCDFSQSDVPRRPRRSLSSTEALNHNLSKKWDTIDVALNIFQQTLTALSYIHLQNIVHHDVKPSNIFIGCEKNGELYVELGDFGLACPLHSKHPTDSIIGTPTYAAPEQLNGNCNPKSDLYSLGIVLLELIISFGTDMERLKVIENARKGTLPDNIPPKLSNLINRLLRYHKKRPDTREALAYLSSLNLSGRNDENSQCNSQQSMERPKDENQNLAAHNQKQEASESTKTSKNTSNSSYHVSVMETVSEKRIAMLETQLNESNLRNIKLNEEIQILRDIISQNSINSSNKIKQDETNNM